jgi:hypothetical protein
MSIKAELLETIEPTPEPLLQEALNHLHYLLEKHLEGLEEHQDQADLKLARADLQHNRTIALAQLTQELGQ